MKTIFDWLTMPVFRERTGMFLGRRDPEALDIWIDGYQRACEDASEHERLRTPAVLRPGFCCMRDSAFGRMYGPRVETIIIGTGRRE